jgi:hypothetical protein
VSRLIEQLHQFMIQDGVRAMIKNVNIYQESLPRSTMILSRPESYSQHRLWVVPRITDYSQARFFLDVQNCAAVNIPQKQLLAFSSQPLAPIKLGEYVANLTKSQMGEILASPILPFDVSAHRVAQTHCSQATLQRVRDDVQKYATQANAETTPCLIGFTPQEVYALHSNPASLGKATGQLNKLVRALNQAMEFDRKSIWNLMKRALAIATSDERSDTPNAGGPNGEINFAWVKWESASLLLGLNC